MGIHHTNTHMSDIVCNYKIQNTDQSGYFLLDTNSTLRQLKAFVSREFLEGARPLRISTGEKVLKNDHDLQHTLQAEPVEFTIARIVKNTEERSKSLSSPIREEQEVEPMIPQQASDSSSQSLVGPHLTAIFTQAGISLDRSVMQSLQELPPPMPALIRQYAQQGSKNSKIPHRLANQLSRRYNVPKKDLLLEIQEALAVVAPETEENDLTIQEEKKKLVPVMCRGRIGPHRGMKMGPRMSHQAICDECKQQIQGVRFKCLQCEDFDFCEQCENNDSIRSQHPHDHVFAKLYRRQDFHTVHKLKSSTSQVVPRPGRPVFAPMPRDTRHTEKMARVDALEKSVKQLEAQIASLSQDTH